MPVALEYLAWAKRIPARLAWWIFLWTPSGIQYFLTNDAQAKIMDDLTTILDMDELERILAQQPEGGPLFVLNCEWIGPMEDTVASTNVKSDKWWTAASLIARGFRFIMFSMHWGSVQIDRSRCTCDTCKSISEDGAKDDWRSKYVSQECIAKDTFNMYQPISQADFERLAGKHRTHPKHSLHHEKWPEIESKEDLVLDVAAFLVDPWERDPAKSDDEENESIVQWLMRVSERCKGLKCEGAVFKTEEARKQNGELVYPGVTCGGIVGCFITAEKGGVARAKGEGEKET